MTGYERDAMMAVVRIANELKGIHNVLMEIRDAIEENTEKQEPVREILGLE